MYIYPKLQKNNVPVVIKLTQRSPATEAISAHSSASQASAPQTSTSQAPEIDINLQEYRKDEYTLYYLA